MIDVEKVAYLTIFGCVCCVCVRVFVGLCEFVCVLCVSTFFRSQRRGRLLVVVGSDARFRAVGELA